MFNIDAQPHNADWTKHKWSLPPYNSKEFMDYLKSAGMTIEEFRQLPIYKFAVKNGKIVNDQWVGGEEDK